MSHMQGRITEIRNEYIFQRDALLEDLERAESNNVNEYTMLLKEFRRLSDLITECDNVLKLIKGESE